MATLKMSDLSVGDWVRVINQFNAQIDGYHSGSGSLSLKTRQGNLVHYRLEDIRPIPITAEMLESNGFVDKGSRLFPYEREWRGGKSTVNICSFDEELWFVDVEFRDGPTCMSDIPLIYIHQLQHILRLIEVDKEINL